MIWSLDQVHEFVSRLPDLDEGQCYLLMLTVRSRYVKEILGIKLPDTVLEREIVYWYYDDWRDVFIRKVRKLAVLGKHTEDIYSIRKGGKCYPVPREALGILAVINPADVRKALASMTGEVVSSVLLSNDLRAVANISKRWFANLHRRAKSVFHTIDIDDKGLLEPILSKLKAYTSPYMIIETTRGYHVIVHVPSLGDRARGYFKYFVNWELNVLMKSMAGNKIEYIKQGLEPVPGTIYGGHKIKLIGA